MSRVIAGVDGGQSATRAIVAGEQGAILGRGVGPPADLVGEARDSGRQRAAIERSVAIALADAGLERAAPLAALVVGLTGYDTPTALPGALAPLAREVVVVHDAVVAHAGALGGDAGIVVVAGTGSVALGRAAKAGAFVRAGGWGYFFGDEGSAVWIARRAIAFGMRDADRGERSALGDAALRFFGARDLRELQHAFAHGELTRPALAAFAADVLALADGQDPGEPAARLRAARLVRDEAAAALVELCVTVAGRLPQPASLPISYAGGVFGSDGLRRTFRRLLERAVDDRSEPAGTVVEPRGDALDGALELARRLARAQPVATRIAAADPTSERAGASGDGR